MSDTSAQFALRNRQVLAVFWALSGLGCLLLPLSPVFRQSRTLPILLVVGVCILLSSWGFHQGYKWGRVAIGIVVAPLSLLCFDRLMTMHFQRYTGPYFWVCCVLLAAGFYTWVFIFTGLDRDAPRRRRRHRRSHNQEEENE